ncbi:uncharacterized protein LOC141907536 [Tubulanus polymorphus]|uniref:uncharacterized protein LOC141907536 n=1 Tax=Tubulanus polymorphus TaxID=672921 RepID=UPI003DA29568
MKLFCLMVLCGVALADERYSKRYYPSSYHPGSCGISREKFVIKRAALELGSRIIGKFLEVVSCEDGLILQKIGYALNAMISDRYNFDMKLCKVFTHHFKNPAVINQIPQLLMYGMRGLEIEYERLKKIKGGNKNQGGTGKQDGMPDIGGTGKQGGSEDLGGTGEQGGSEDLGGTGVQGGSEDLGGTGVQGGSEDLGGTGVQGGSEDLGGNGAAGGDGGLGGTGASGGAVPP